jgi:hypothetical protein
VNIDRREIDERLRRAAEIRRTLRRATKKLMELGRAALDRRGAEAPEHGGSRSR